MANFTDPYNPIFYAQEALIILENALGMTRRIHRGYDSERKSSNRGDTIQIHQPGTFINQAGGTGTAADVAPTYIQMTLDNWREVKFGLTDQELAYTSEKIISDHIGPAVYSLANYIETQITNLYADVPWFLSTDETPDAQGIIDARKILRDNAGGLVDTDMIHYAVSSWMESKLLGLDLFHSAAVADKDAQIPRMKGSLGTRFGIEHFVQQTLASHTSGTVVSAGTDLLGALNAATAIRDTTINVDAFDGVETFVHGDVLQITGDAQNYVVGSAGATLSGGANTAIPIYPAIKQVNAEDAVVTAETEATDYADAYDSNIMFHRNAFAIAMAPLPMIGDGAGAKMAVITDPRTGLSIRSRVAYDDANANVLVTLDVLFGVKTLDPNLAVIVRRNTP